MTVDAIHCESVDPSGGGADGIEGGSSRQSIHMAPGKAIECSPWTEWHGPWV